VKAGAQPPPEMLRILNTPQAMDSAQRNKGLLNQPFSQTARETREILPSFSSAFRQMSARSVKLGHGHFRQ
jgi:hypothetical protein